MRFIWLSEILEQLHAALRQHPELSGGDVKASAALLMLAAKYTEPDPVMTNIAALVIRQGRLTVHRLMPEVVEQVNETDVRSLPSEAPRLMRGGAFCIEAASVSNPLFGEVLCLGGYEIEGRWWLVMLTSGGAAVVGSWRPRWGDGDVETGFFFDPSPFVDVEKAETYRDLTIHGARYALTLGALLDAEGTPLESIPQTVTPAAPKIRRATKATQKPAAWTVRNIRLTPMARPQIEERSDTQTGEPASREGLTAEKRQIRGFLRRQPHGPGRSERKWVYVASFESTRYVGQKPLRINVQGGE